jgi:hypothetical protein
LKRDLLERLRSLLKWFVTEASALLWRYLKGSRFVMAGGYEPPCPPQPDSF